MKLEKLVVFKKIVEIDKLYPTSPLFQKAVKDELLKSISEEADLNFVDAETLKNVDQAAKNFKYSMLTLWKR